MESVEFKNHREATPKVSDSHARRCTHARRFVAIETTRSHPAQTYKQQSSLDFRVPAGTDVMGPSESAGLLAQTV